MGVTILSQIGIGDTRAQYIEFQLYPTPSAVVAHTVDVLRSIPDMANDTDEFLLPVDFEDLLLDKAEMKELRKQDDPNRYAMLRGDFRHAVFIEPQLWEHFGSEERVIEALRLLVELARRETRSVA